MVLFRRENKIENIGENISEEMAGVTWVTGWAAGQRQPHRRTSEVMMGCLPSNEVAGHRAATDAESYASSPAPVVPLPDGRLLGCRDNARSRPYVLMRIANDGSALPCQG